MTLLTIGIPTYNRAKELERLLDRIVPACDLLDIEILVSDNCSTDDTSTVLEKYKNFKCLRYIRNAANLGFDGNILNLIAKASGEFLWWLGDDDNIAVEQLGGIKRLLQDNPAVALFFVGYMHDLPRNKHKSSGTNLQCKVLSAQQYADRYLHKATLISTNILNLAVVKSLRINQACVSKGWVNLHLLLLLVDQIKEKNGQVVVINNPVVIQGMEEGRTPVNKWEKQFIDNFDSERYHR
jgi:glycosyltransferase involved in cell wall biosynthesis